MEKKSLLSPPLGFDELPIEDQISYVQLLWDQIAAHPDRVPVPDWHLQVINERLAASKGGPEKGKPWEEARDEIRSELAGKPPVRWTK